MDAFDRIAFLTFLAMVVPTCFGHIADPKDEFWVKRAEEAKIVAHQAYEPDPYIVTNHLNKLVHESTKITPDLTRRSLTQKHNGACEATNPIDKCWRCKKNWINNRRRLADCAVGFGRRTTGGKAGRTYVVTDPSDSDLLNPKRGTLRHAVIQKEPLWIIFAHDMVIRLTEELIMTSNKTIDGRGAQVHITKGAGLTLQYIHNVIIHNIRVYDIKVGKGGMIRDSLTHYGLRTKSDGDAISIFGSTHVWVDHVSLSNCYDGLIDVIQASTAVTISNCHFAHHNDVMLLGASDKNSADKILQVTLAFNHFGRGLIQRMPRMRWGFVHVVNNDYTMWEMYAIGGSQHPTILSQGNRFYGPNNTNAKEVTKREYVTKDIWKHWVWRSEGDLLMNGAFFIQSGDPHTKFPTATENISPKPGNMASTLTRYAGPLGCHAHKPC